MTRRFVRTAGPVCALLGSVAVLLFVPSEVVHGQESCLALRAPVDATLRALDIATLQASAEGGDADALLALWIAFASGNGVAKDEDEAKRWFWRAVERGHGLAAYYLADAVEQGRGGDKDLGIAAQWFLSAAATDEFSRFRAGWLYVRGGPGLDRDLDQGLALIVGAAANGYLRARAFLGAIYEGRYGVARDEPRALGYYVTGAESGDRRSQYRLALALYRGELGLAKDGADALLWFTAAAERGDGDAQAFLAGMIERGEGAARDPAEALKWAMLACRSEGAPGAEVRERLVARSSPGQIDEAKERAAVWLDIKAYDATERPGFRGFVLRKEPH